MAFNLYQIRTIDGVFITFKLCSYTTTWRQLGIHVFYMNVKKGVAKYQICKKKRVYMQKYDGKAVISADFSQNRQEYNDIAIWKI